MRGEQEVGTPPRLQYSPAAWTDASTYRFDTFE